MKETKEYTFTNFEKVQMYATTSYTIIAESYDEALAMLKESLHNGDVDYYSNHDYEYWYDDVRTVDEHWEYENEKIVF